jgi:hypothetical protein
VARTLHITNGDSVSIRETGLGGDVLAWQDVLHEGPVPAGLMLHQLRPLRARFLADLSGRPEPEILSDLERRDRALSSFRQSDEVVLWFEHDLFDQLQLIQILDWLASQNADGFSLTLIDSPHYLGPMNPEQLIGLYPNRLPVTRAQFDLASRAWTAFRSPDPRVISRLLREDTSALPHLSGALDRHLEQFPSAQSGLCRTERQILEIVAEGTNRVDAIFRADQEREERIFMGDIVFNGYIQGLASARVPLLRIAHPGQRFNESRVELTPEGDSVLHGKADHIDLNGIDRWRGGVHLHADNVWHADKVWRPSQSLEERGPFSGREVWRWSSRDRGLVN